MYAKRAIKFSTNINTKSNIVSLKHVWFTFYIILPFVALDIAVCYTSKQWHNFPWGFQSFLFWICTHAWFYRFNLHL